MTTSRESSPAAFAQSWEQTFQRLHREQGGKRITSPVVLSGFEAAVWRAFVFISVLSFLLRVLGAGLEALT